MAEGNPRVYAEEALRRLGRPGCHPEAFPVLSPPSVVRVPGPVNGAARPRLVLGVTTFNRREYLQRFVESFDATRSHDFDWTLVIADDGSSDSTYAYLDGLRLDDCQIVVIRNKRASVTGQTNSIFAAARSIGFDFGFKADDDIFFTRPGWDSLYVEASRGSGFPHLVFHSTQWTPAKHDITRGLVHSFVPADTTMGCFWTFTPDVLEQLGWFDEVNFRLRGHAHWDFTFRACRLGFNEFESAWDAAGSMDYISLWGRDEYMTTISWTSPEVKAILTAQERARRDELIRGETRVHVPRATSALGGRPPSVMLTPRNRRVARRIRTTGMTVLEGGLRDGFERAFVLNLVGDIDRWVEQAAAFAASGIVVERFAGVDGRRPDIEADWKAYNARGNELPLERQIGRRLIASPGAWAYSLGLRQILEAAVRDRLTSIIVLDDDVALHHHAPYLLEQALAELPSEWKLVYLGATQTDWAVAERYSPHLYRPMGRVDGSYGVAIHHSVFALLIEEIDRFEAPFDSGPLKRVVDEHPEQVFVIWPNAVIADVRTSSLRAPRSQSDFAIRARWRLADYGRDFSSDSPPPRERETDESEMVSILVSLERADWWNWHGLESLRGQSHKNFEVLLVPDPSFPHLLEHATSLAATDSRITVIEASDAVTTADRLNVALDVARGRYVSLQQPSELSSPERIDETLRLAVLSGGPVAARLCKGGHVHGTGPRSYLPASSTLSLESGLVPRTMVRQVGGFMPEASDPLTDVVLRHQRLEQGAIQGVSQLVAVPRCVGTSVGTDAPDLRDGASDLGVQDSSYNEGRVPAVLSTARLVRPRTYRVVRPG